MTENMQTQIDKLTARVERLENRQGNMIWRDNTIINTDKTIPTPPGDGDQGADDLAEAIAFLETKKVGSVEEVVRDALNYGKPSPAPDEAGLWGHDPQLEAACKALAAEDEWSLVSWSLGTISTVQRIAKALALAAPAQPWGCAFCRKGGVILTSNDTCQHCGQSFVVTVKPDSGDDASLCEICGQPTLYGSRHSMCGEYALRMEREIAGLRAAPADRAVVVTDVDDVIDGAVSVYDRWKGDSASNRQSLRAAIEYAAACWRAAERGEDDRG